MPRLATPRIKPALAEPWEWLYWHRDAWWLKRCPEEMCMTTGDQAGNKQPGSSCPEEPGDWNKWRASLGVLKAVGWIGKGGTAYTLWKGLTMRPLPQLPLLKRLSTVLFATVGCTGSSKEDMKSLFSGLKLGARSWGQGHREPGRVSNWKAGGSWEWEGDLFYKSSLGWLNS